MSINSVSSTSSLLNVQSVGGDLPSSTSTTGDTTSISGVTVDISKPGQLMSQLGALAQNDPAQFKSVTADIAQQLKDAASSQSGSAANFLNKLADKFSAASQSGNASDLAPAGKAHGHHHGGGGHKVHASANDGSTDAVGGPNDPLAQLVQGIITSALGTTSTSTTPSST
jgi:hypothetical protein